MQSVPPSIPPSVEAGVLDSGEVVKETVRLELGLCGTRPCPSPPAPEGWDKDITQPQLHHLGTDIIHLTDTHSRVHQLLILFLYLPAWSVPPDSAVLDCVGPRVGCPSPPGPGGLG